MYHFIKNYVQAASKDPKKTMLTFFHPPNHFLTFPLISANIDINRKKS